MPPTPEFDLAVACCRWPPTPERERAVRAAAAAAINWDLFGRVVARHRVHGLVHDGLRRAGVLPPAPLAERLADAAGAIVRENLRFASVSARLGRLLGDAGIAHLFVKGVTLNILAYGSLGLKRAWDIDMAVDPVAYAHACRVMEDAGLRLVSGGPDAGNKHSEWADPSGVAVELHASLTDNHLMLPGLSAAGPRQLVAVAPGLSLPTLPPDALYAYLCVHGATHAWSRLKWIADVAALLAPLPDAEVARLHRAAEAMGAGRSSGQALLLARRLFGRPLPPELDRAISRDLATRALVRAALGSMVRGGPDVELDALVLGTVPIHLSHFFLGRGWRYKWAEAKRKLGGSPLRALGAWLARRSVAAR